MNAKTRKGWNCKRGVSLEEVVQARQELVEMGLVEDSGERRPNPDGSLGIVWRTTALSGLVKDYRQRGLTFEQAVAKAQAAVRRPH